jgi:fatty-acid desaturase
MVEIEPLLVEMIEIFGHFDLVIKIFWLLNSMTKKFGTQKFSIAKLI